MRKFILTAVFILTSIMAYAQCYVYEVTGEVFICHDGQWRNACRTMQVSADDHIRTGQFSSVVILDRGNGRLYAFQCVEATPLSDLISRNRPKTKRLLPEILQGLFNALFSSNDKSMSAYETVSGVVYRGEEEDRIIASAIAAGQPSSPLLSFRMLDRKSMQPLTEVHVGDEAVVEVTNHADFSVYFNIIDTDAAGNSAPVLPFDEHQTMLHLYAPPHSTVRLTAYPVGFYEPCGGDTLTLVASVHPFNLKNVINLLSSAEPSPSRDVFIQRSSINIVASHR